MFDNILKRLTEGVWGDDEDDFGMFDEFMNEIDDQAREVHDFGDIALKTFAPRFRQEVQKSTATVVYDDEEDVISIAAPVANAIVRDEDYPIENVSRHLEDIIGIEVPIGFAVAHDHIIMGDSVDDMYPRVSNYGTGHFELIIDIGNASKADEDDLINKLHKFVDQTAKLFDIMTRIQADEL